MLGQQLHTGKINFQWPSESDLRVFAQSPTIEVGQLVTKGKPGKYLQGIGLVFTSGVRSPFMENAVYSNAVTPTTTHNINLDEPYN